MTSDLSYRHPIYSSSSSVNNEAKNESTSSKSSIGLSSNKEQRIYNSAPLNPINHFVNNHYRKVSSIFLREVDVDQLRRLMEKMKLKIVVLFIHLKIIYIVKIQLHLTLNHFIKEMMTGLNVNLGNSHYHPFILSNQITTIQIHIIVAIPKKMFSPKKYLYHHQMSPNFLLQKDESL